MILTYLPLVAKRQHSVQLVRLHSSQVDHGVDITGDVLLKQQPLEERAAGGMDQLVSLHLLIFTGQGDVKEVAFVLELRERLLYILVKFVPFQK